MGNMPWKNLFDEQEARKAIARINALHPDSQPLWGKMGVSQMLAHCNVAYEMVYTNKHPKAKGLPKFLIKLFAKKAVVGPKPYKKNSPTAPVFIIILGRSWCGVAIVRVSAFGCGTIPLFGPVSESSPLRGRTAVGLILISPSRLNF